MIGNVITYTTAYLIAAVILFFISFIPPIRASCITCWFNDIANFISLYGTLILATITVYLTYKKFANGEEFLRSFSKLLVITSVIMLLLNLTNVALRNHYPDKVISHDTSTQTTNDI